MDLNGFTDFTETPSVHRGDDALLVRFHDVLIKNEYRSEQSGKPEYDTIEHIEIPLPGGKNVYYDRLTDEHRERFASRYKRWKESKESGTTRPIDGTPLSQLTILDAGQVRLAEMANVFTVEQLAAASDSVIQDLGMGFPKYREHAKAYLEAAKTTSIATKFVAELGKRDDTISQLQAQIDELKKSAEKKR